jgi:hypothetical protein
MAFLSEIREAVLGYDGGYLGGYRGTVDADPDLLDPDAARSIISARFYDGEKLSNAYGGTYFWIPKYSDNRRAETRGYRILFSTIFEPPQAGTFVLSFYGYGATIEMPSGTPEESVEQSIHEVHPDLGDTEVIQNPDGTLDIRLPKRIGMGSSSGRLRSNGGLGVVVMNRDFSQPLTKGTEWWASPSIPFDNADGITGINTCINDALYDLREEDLVPIESIGTPGQTRDNLVYVYSLFPWLEPDAIVGYYGPTDWESVTTLPIRCRSGRACPTARTSPPCHTTPPEPSCRKPCARSRCPGRARPTPTLRCRPRRPRPPTRSHGALSTTERPSCPRGALSPGWTPGAYGIPTSRR